MKTVLKVTIASVLVAGVGGGALAQEAAPPDPSYQGLRPRRVTAKEREQVTRSIAERFGYKVGPTAEFRAAGAYRFAGDNEFLYIERTDAGSIAFERASYGVAKAALEPQAVSREVLLPRLEAALRRAAPAAAGVRFALFEDEFAGAVQPEKQPADFDPRRASLHVARTARFDRVVSEVPVFGSELIVGLSADGSIGRFRLHHPTVEARLVESARKLQSAVKDGAWRAPESLREKGVEVLETTAGVAHSGFSDPAMKSAAVVRVLVRKSTPDQPYPLSSTSYRYFDAAGREVWLSSFPSPPATPAARKKG